MSDPLATIRGGTMVKRFTKKQAELAAKISNDIAENTDGGEPRGVLRMAVAYYADLFAVESQKRAAFETKLKLIRIAMKGIR